MASKRKPKKLKGRRLHYDGNVYRDSRGKVICRQRKQKVEWKD